MKNKEKIKHLLNAIGEIEWLYGCSCQGFYGQDQDCGCSDKDVCAYLSGLLLILNDLRNKEDLKKICHEQHTQGRFG